MAQYRVPRSFPLKAQTSESHIPPLLLHILVLTPRTGRYIASELGDNFRSPTEASAQVLLTQQDVNRFHTPIMWKGLDEYEVLTKSRETQPSVITPKIAFIYKPSDAEHQSAQSTSFNSSLPSPADSSLPPGALRFRDGACLSIVTIADDNDVKAETSRLSGAMQLLADEDGTHRGPETIGDSSGAAYSVYNRLINPGHGAPTAKDTSFVYVPSAKDAQPVLLKLQEQRTDKANKALADVLKGMQPGSS